MKPQKPSRRRKGKGFPARPTKQQLAAAKAMYAPSPKKGGSP
jgi:hypothetical protein